MIRINDIIEKVVAHNPKADVDLINQAYVYSARVHAGQVRLSGEPYLSHPLEVAHILAQMKLDTVSIAAGLLHDVVEDTHATEVEIGEIFGSEVQHIVAGVTKLSTLTFASSRQRQAESIRKMLLAMADDIRVILIKLADRLHNMRTLRFHSQEGKRRKIAQETLDIYAPIASRLGIYWIKSELEDISFMYLQPEAYERIKGLVAKDREQREAYIQEVKQLIKGKMAENHLECSVTGRYKRFYSIYHKMLSQNLDFEEVYDIIAFRIILDTIPQCYEALGHVHAMWKPIDYKFKDYIGRPKPNMYQSLHTTVIGPRGERVEIQIRTHEMDRVAESGIAAHWSYKEGRSIDETASQRFAWIQSIVENQENIRDPNEFLENVRIDLFPDEVYVFTPQGDIKSLPRGATPVDFAYLIHTEVGHRCTGAKVNGRMVPLKYELKTGDIVEILTAKNHHPSKDWIKFVRTVKARSRIRQWIKIQERQRSLTLGREMCEKAFQKEGLSFNAFLKSEKLPEIVQSLGFKSADDLIASVGYGKNTPLQIIRKYMPKPDSADDGSSIFNKLIGKVRRKKARDGILVKGLDDILVKFGKCCRPVPGDPITGYITQGFGVTVHRSSCKNALKMNPERQIEVQWSDAVTDTYPVKIRVSSYDRMGLLADVAAAIAKHNANILNANTSVRDNKVVDSQFTIAVKDTAHLNQVLAEIRKVKRILDVKRLDI